MQNGGLFSKNPLFFGCRDFQSRYKNTEIKNLRTQFICAFSSILSLNPQFGNLYVTIKQ